MGRIVSIDDDIDFSLALKEKLKFYVKDEILLFNKVNLQVLESYVLDLVFLDIEMNEVNGIDIARELNKRKDAPVIIFVSNQEGLIHDSLSVQPFYFIRKQHLEEDLHNAFTMLTMKKFRTTMKVKIATDIIDVNDIVYVESNNHHITVYTKYKTYQYRITLEEVATILATYQCVRIHRSFIINMEYIKRWYSNRVLLVDDISVEIGRTYYVQAKNKYQDFMIKRGM